MWAIVGILTAAVLIALFEVPSLLKRGYKKELWVFSVLLLVATGLCIAKSMDVKIPNPIDWISAVFKPLSDFLAGALK